LERQDLRVDIKVLKAQLADLKTKNELSRMSAVDAEIERVIT
jgi:hypothetical protein